MKKSIVCDLDNTLFNIDHVLNPRTENGFHHKDWDGRAKCLDKDTIVYPVFHYLEMCRSANFVIYLLTSRPEHLRELTLKQLSKFGVPFNTLIMADEKDPHYANSNWKLDVVKVLNLLNPVHVILEDIDSNVQLLRRAGFQVWQVKQDNFSERPRGVVSE